MSDVVLDANVIVGMLDEGDSLHASAHGLVAKLKRDGHRPVLLDFLLAEALSALCRRSFERKRRPPVLSAVVGWIDRRRQGGRVRFPALTGGTFDAALRIVEASRGELKFNDARLVVMQRGGEIGDVASFDADFDTVDGFRRLS